MRAGFWIGTMGLALLGELWFVYGQDHSARFVVQRLEDVVDRRPATAILLIGNSRTFWHGMPGMLRSIADSASSPTKFEIDMDASGGASFENLWGEQRTQRLLHERWDEIILQGESRGQSSDTLKASFLEFGEKLLRESRPKAGPPELVVN